MKTCKTCHQEKDESGFYILHRRGKQYLRGACIACCRSQLDAIKETESGREAAKAAARKYMANQKLLAEAALEAIKAGLIQDPRKKNE